MIRFPDGGSLYLLAEMRGLVHRELQLLSPTSSNASDATPTTPTTPVDRELRVFVRGEQGQQVHAASASGLKLLVHQALSCMCMRA